MVLVLDVPETRPQSLAEMPRKRVHTTEDPDIKLPTTNSSTSRSPSAGDQQKIPKKAKRNTRNRTRRQVKRQANGPTETGADTSTAAQNDLEDSGEQEERGDKIEQDEQVEQDEHVEQEEQEEREEEGEVTDSMYLPIEDEIMQQKYFHPYRFTPMPHEEDRALFDMRATGLRVQPAIIPSKQILLEQRTCVVCNGVGHADRECPELTVCFLSTLPHPFLT